MLGYTAVHLHRLERRVEFALTSPGEMPYRKIMLGS